MKVNEIIKNIDEFLRIQTPIVTIENEIIDYAGLEHLVMDKKREDTRINVFYDKNTLQLYCFYINEYVDCKNRVELISIFTFIDIICKIKEPEYAKKFLRALQKYLALAKTKGINFVSQNETLIEKNPFPYYSFNYDEIYGVTEKIIKNKIKEQILNIIKENPEIKTSEILNKIEYDGQEVQNILDELAEDQKVE